MRRRVRRGTLARVADPVPPSPKQGAFYAVRVAPPGARYGDVPAEPGRLVRLDVRANPARAARLLDLGYLVGFEGEPVTCRACPGLFADEASRDAHGRRIHEARPDPAARALRGRAQDLRQIARRRKLSFDEQAELDHLETQAAMALEAEDNAAEKRVASPYMNRTTASRQAAAS